MEELEKKVAELEARAVAHLPGGAMAALKAAAKAGPIAEVIGAAGKLPDWLVPAARRLVTAAEKAFGAGNGEKKKAFVRAGLLHLAESHDIKWLPDAIEKPLEHALVDLLIEVTYSWLKDEGFFALPRGGAAPAAKG